MCCGAATARPSREGGEACGGHEGASLRIEPSKSHWERSGREESADLVAWDPRVRPRMPGEGRWGGGSVRHFPAGAAGDRALAAGGGPARRKEEEGGK